MIVEPVLILPYGEAQGKELVNEYVGTASERLGRRVDSASLLDLSASDQLARGPAPGPVSDSERATRILSFSRDVRLPMVPPYRRRRPGSRAPVAPSRPPPGRCRTAGRGGARASAKRPMQSQQGVGRWRRPPLVSIVRPPDGAVVQRPQPRPHGPARVEALEVALPGTRRCRASSTGPDEPRVE